MGIDSPGSSVDGHGETMEEELKFGEDEYSLLAEQPFTIYATGDLVD